MGIFSALFAGVNGINSNGDVISVIGDNIANVNTVGFKSYRASFEDVLAGAGIGLGSRVSDVTAEFSQGGFESSGNVTDLAIDGSGFFQVIDPNDSSVFFTRAGQFNINKDGYLVNPDGLRLQGFQTDANDAITSSTGDILISSAPVQPVATDEVTVVANLNSNSTVPGAFSTVNPGETSNFSAGVTVFDSLGNDHLVTVYFRKTSSNNWSWHALVDGGELTNPSSGVNVEAATGTLTFDTQGRLTASATTSSDFDFADATQNQTISFDFGTPTSLGTGLDGVTQFGSASTITNITQDGFASGSLSSLSIDAEGVISGNYTNGTTRQIAQVMLATFNNSQALARAGSNNYTETLSSGAPIIGSPASGGKGSIVSNTLEQSNVDLANELIKMVIIQRGFQANSRTITTVNDLLAQLVTLGQ